MRPWPAGSACCAERIVGHVAGPLQLGVAPAPQFGRQQLDVSRRVVGRSLLPLGDGVSRPFGRPVDLAGRGLLRGWQRQLGPGLVQRSRSQRPVAADLRCSLDEPGQQLGVVEQSGDLTAWRSLRIVSPTGDIATRAASTRRCPWLRDRPQRSRR